MQNITEENIWKHVKYGEAKVQEKTREFRSPVIIRHIKQIQL